MENDNPNKKPSKKNEEKEIAWVSPESDMSDSDDISDFDKNTETFLPLVEKKGFLNIFSNKNKKEKKSESDFADKKKLLKEYHNSAKKNNAKTEIEKKQTKNNLLASKLSGGSALKTNLVKEDVTTFVDWRKNIIFLLLGLIFSSAFIGGLYGRLIFSEQQAYRTLDDLDSEIAELKNRIYAAKENSQEAEKFQKKLKLAGGLLANHTYWTNFFEFLETNILSDTYINGGVSADFGTDFTFDIFAKTYANIDEQLLVLEENEIVEEASVNSGLMDFDSEEERSRIKYSLDIKILPEIFLKK